MQNGLIAHCLYCPIFNTLPPRTAPMKGQPMLALKHIALKKHQVYIST